MKPSVGFLTTSELVEAIKRRAAVPSAQNTLRDVDIIRFMNEEMKDNIVPLLKASKEEYLIYSELIPLVANQSKYDIPYRAVGAFLRDLKYEDSYGGLGSMTQIQPEDRHYFQGSAVNSFNTFYFEGDNIVMWPGVGSAAVGGLRVLFYMRPNDLVDEDRVGQITDIDRTLGIITLDNLPDHITSGNNIDLLKWKPSHKIISYDIPVVSTNSTNKQITLDPADIPLDLAVDDILASAGECIIPQLPPELQTLLVEKVVAQCMKAQGDLEGYTLSINDLKVKETNAVGLIKNRSEGNNQKFNNFNSTLRSGKYRRGW